MSYSSKDRERVTKLVSDLEDLGHQVWFDQEISGGHEWWAQIVDSIKSCELFIFALSSSWLSSYPCSLEFEYATKLKKNRLPVRIERLKLLRTLPRSIQELQFVEYTEYTVESLKLLARSISNLPAPQSLPDVLPIPPEAPISVLSRLTVELSSEKILSISTQREILTRLIALMNDPLERDGALELLHKLEHHPDASAQTIKEIGIVRAGIDSTAAFKIEAANTNLNPSIEAVYLLVDVHSEIKHELKNRRIIVGRATSCDVVVNDRFFSRMQFALDWNDEKETYLLIDTGAANPIFLNGNSITGGARVPLSDGDEIHCGETTFRFMSTISYT